MADHSRERWYMSSYWGNLLKALLGQQVCPPPVGTIERPSPHIRITPEQADLLIKAIREIPGYESCFITAIAPSNSMEPGVDDGMYTVLDPTVPSYLGDMIWYKHPDFGGPQGVFHRIVEVGTDPEWYCKTKGDNNDYPDPVLVRPENIKGVWRATLN